MVAFLRRAVERTFDRLHGPTGHITRHGLRAFYDQPSGSARAFPFLQKREKPCRAPANLRTSIAAKWTCCHDAAGAVEEALGVARHAGLASVISWPAWHPPRCPRSVRNRGV